MYVFVTFFSLYLFNDLSSFKVKFYHLKVSSTCLSKPTQYYYLIYVINIILVGFKYILILSTQLALGLTVKTEMKMFSSVLYMPKVLKSLLTVSL